MRRDKTVLLGAAIGLGMTARAAVDGGADFLLVLNAGRLRVMGAPSVAAMLPIRDANAFTDAFARAEILDRFPVPVFLGAAACDPRRSVEAVVAAAKEAGYAGMANFPTAIHFSGALREALEAEGLGFGREARMLAAARAAGLATLGYAKTRAEVEALLDVGVERLCLNFGWNAGGRHGVPGHLPLDDAAEIARRIFARVRRRAPGTLCLLEGGPIVDAEHVRRVCEASLADGYIGGSTLDRLPLELAVMQSTSAFKTARMTASAEGDLPGLAGRSAAARALAGRLGRLAGTDLPVLLEGEPGSGRSTAARALHAAGRGGPLTWVSALDERAARLLDPDVPASPLRARGTVVIEDAESLAPTLRAQLAEWIDRGTFGRFTRPSGRAARARLVLVHPPGAEPLARALSAQRVLVPPLRDRLEDLPALARALLRATGRPAQLDPLALRLLVSRPWPGNLRELGAVLIRAATEARGSRITAAALEALLDPAEELPATAPEDERSWILNALRRHRFRRGETAAFLGIGRKTLYNRMRRLGLDAA